MNQEKGEGLVNSDEDSSEESSVTDLLESESDFDEDSSDEEINSESLSSTILKEIQEGTYACLVCTSEIDYASTIWSCPGCYRVYDLDCIKDWAIRGSSTDRVNKTWRCPSCNNAIKNIPKTFTCWCGKTKHPSLNKMVPFSCGNPCSAPLDGCIHSCTSMCHPGDHPLCGAMGPSMKCHCGKHKTQLPCIATPYNDGWRCDGECGIELCEFGHKCEKGCHSGFCGPCEEQITIKCFCGGEYLDIKCHEKILKSCNNKDDKWIGGGACNKKIKRFYDCNIHFEEHKCSEYTSETRKCPLDPEMVSTCYCGKCEISIARTSCTDPIPKCENICGKKLACGCDCLQKCHDGECECINIKEHKCSCGFSSYLVPCKFLQRGNLPKCTHECFALLSCRKHQHKMTCCPSEQEALKRERSRKRAIRNNLRSNFDDEIMSIEPLHICTRICNRLKPCGRHYCDALCHSGQCGVCLESSNEDLVCHCGKTVIEAPVRCGTKIDCNEQCVREKACGHPQEPHKCHSDDIDCPKCTSTVTKACNCGKKSNVPYTLCSQTNVICGITCTEKKACGHKCTRVCSSSCTRDSVHESSTLCQSPCQKSRSNCPHVCQMRCHFNKVGKSKNCDANPCKISIKITCNCGRIVKSVPCNSSLVSESNIGSYLDCDEGCSREKRNKELSEAFESSTKQDGPDGDYSNIVLSIYKNQEKWCSIIESFILDFVEHRIQNDDNKKFHNFSPMNTAQILFIQELCKSYKLYSDIEGEGPKKHVFIHMKKDTVIPEISIKDTIAKLKKLEQERIERVRMEKESLRDVNCNAILLQDVFMGITRQDLEKELIESNSDLAERSCAVDWLKEGQFVFYFQDSFKNTSDSDELELNSILKSFRSIIREKSLAFDCKLCLIDENNNEVLKVDSESVVSNRLDALRAESTESTTANLE